MKKPYDLVVFDWEGTLAEDSLGLLSHYIAQEAKRLQFGELDLSIVRDSVRFGLTSAVYQLFPELTLYQHAQLLHAVQDSLAESDEEVMLVPGMRALVMDLFEADFLLAIATNKRANGLQKALQWSELAHFFKATRSAGDLPPKPCPQMLEELMAELGVSASETLMIGDSALDMEMATAIGVDAIGVDFYGGQEDGLRVAGARAVFTDSRQIADFLGLKIAPHTQD